MGFFSYARGTLLILATLLLPRLSGRQQEVATVSRPLAVDTTVVRQSAVPSAADPTPRPLFFALLGTASCLFRAVCPTSAASRHVVLPVHCTGVPRENDFCFRTGRSWSKLLSCFCFSTAIVAVRVVDKAEAAALSSPHVVYTNRHKHDNNLSYSSNSFIGPGAAKSGPGRLT